MRMRQQLLLLLLTAHLAAAGSSSSNSSDGRLLLRSGASTSEFIQRLLHQSRYDDSCRAVPEGGGPTLVGASVSIDSFGPVDAVNMDYWVEAVLRLSWYDLRLRFASSGRRRRKPLVLSESVGAVWKPGVFFPNAKTIQRHAIPSPNLLLWLWSNGSLLYSQKLNAKFHCHMNLKDFPFDTQSCDMLLSVFELSTEDLVLHWAPPGVVFTDRSSVQLNEFFPPLVNVSAGASYSAATGANFTRLTATYRLRRRHLYYVITSYLPSVLIVLITWSSFAIDYRSAPARVSLSIMSLLALLTESAAVEAKLPRVPYVTTLGIWHLCCIVFIHVSLVEYMLINVLLVVQKRRRRRLERQESAVSTDCRLQHQRSLLTSSDSCGSKPPASRVEASAHTCLRPATLDLCFLLLYPVAFGVFNIVYWTVLVPRQ